MKASFTTLFVLLLLPLSYAQDIAYSNQMIDRLEQIRYDNMNTAEDGNHRACLTTLLREVRQNQDQLDANTKNVFAQFMARPVLDNEEIVFSDHFDFHYTQTGPDAVDPTDDNFNNIPDYVEAMANVMENVYTQDEQALSYHMPPPDGINGGTEFYDVYIYDVGQGLYGFVMQEDVIGDNPNSSTLTEVAAATSWMGMNIDYSWAPGSLQSALEVTSSHEFFHSIQFGYTSENTNWIDEATAAWMEDVIYPGADDNLQYLSHVFTLPDVALNINHNDNLPDFNGRWYAGWLLFKHLQERHETDLIRKVYERCITENEVAAIHNELVNSYGSNLPQAFANYLVANLVMSDLAQHDPFTYSRADVYSDYLSQNAQIEGVAIEGLFPFDGTTLQWISDVNGNGRLMRFSADYLAIQADQDFLVSLTPDNPQAEMDIVLVKFNSSNQQLAVDYSQVMGNQLVIDVTDQANFDVFVLLVIRFDLISTDIGSEQYTVTVEDSNPTHVEQLGTAVNLNIYPNPASNKITIDLDISNSSDVEVDIRDMSGRLIHQSLPLKENSLDLDTSQWPRGTYFIEIKNDNNLIFVQKIILI